MLSKRLATEFWDWSCRLYQFSEVRKQCLLLQDEHSLNVNFLLLAIWAEQCSLVIRIENWNHIGKQCAQIEVKVEQIRAQRKRLKAVSIEQYKKALAIELKGEKLLQKQAIKSLLNSLDVKPQQEPSNEHRELSAGSANMTQYLKQKGSTQEAKNSAKRLVALVHSLQD